MRILTVANVPADPNSGAAGTDYQTNIAFRELGHEVDEIWSPDLQPRRIRHNNLHALLEQPRLYRAAVRRAITRQKYDLIIMDQAAGYLAAEDLRRKKYPAVVLNRSHGVELRVHEVIPMWQQKLGVAQGKGRLLTRFIRKLLHRQWPRLVKAFDGIIVSNDLDKQYLLKRFSLDPDRILLNAQGLTEHLLRNDDSGIANKSPARFRRLLHVGQFAFFKGPHIVAQIFNQVLQANPDVTATWVTAEAAHPQVRELLANDVRNRVRLVGWVTQEQLREIYDEHGIFIFPSFYEGFGKAPFEAMARGMCVVCSDEGGMRDHIETNVTGILVDVGCVDSFVNTVQQLLSNDINPKCMSTKAAASVAKLTWARCAKEILSFACHSREKAAARSSLGQIE